MSGCEQELCGNWAGNAGYPCDLMDLDTSERPVVRDADPGHDDADPFCDCYDCVDYCEVSS